MILKLPTNQLESIELILGSEDPQTMRREDQTDRKAEEIKDIFLISVLDVFRFANQESHK